MIKNSTSKKLHEIVGNEHAKRAIEVALTGKHSIKFIGNEEAELLTKRANELEAKTWAVKPCPCGNYNDRDKMCICRPSTIKKYIESKKYNVPANLIVECVRPSADKILNYKGENECKILQRVLNARKIKRQDNNKLPIEATELLKSAITQLNLSQMQVENCIEIAKTIAQLDGVENVKIAHIAEALQYRNK